MGEQEGLLHDFLVETKEGLDHLDAELLALESSPEDRDLINAIFRRLHTIKGVCGFLDFHKLESVTHAGETLLGELRSETLKVNDKIVTLLLTLCDAIRTIVSSIEETKLEGDGCFDTLVAELLATAKAPQTPSDTKELSLDEQFELLLAQREAEEALQAAAKPSASNHVASNQAAPTQSDSTSVPETIQTVPQQPEYQEQAQAKPGAPETSLRVDVQLLDHLMNLAGELVLARNQILQTTKGIEDVNFRAITQRLNLVTSELQEGVMKTRMQPINTVWSKFPRVVRDLSLTCKKQVRLETYGKETELDKTLIEAIKDPLTHIVRNSIDHGIELPNARVAKGKSAEGCITMRASQEGGYVIIEIIDDGGGLNTEKIRERALQRGLISREKAQSMSEQEVHRLIFAPGFSTADTITNLSGRGVGMDVVKSSVEKIGGHVDITSHAGEGSSIRLKIPLTLAIIPALLLSCAGQKFAVPQSAITELVQLGASEKVGSLSWIGNYPFYKLRGDLLPLLFLSKQLRVSTHTEVADEDKVIVVIDIDGSRFGVVVDAVHDTEEIVVKPLGRQLGNLPIYAGATILGDGQIALIIDPVVLGRAANIEQQEAAIGHASSVATGPTVSESEQLLIVQVTAEERAAIPLNQVRRLEEFPLQNIESVGSSSVIQYRGSILQLVDVAACVAHSAEPWAGGHVVVVGNGESLVGLQVREILDVTTQLTAVKPVHGRPGLTSYGVVQGKVIALLDVDYLAKLGAMGVQELDGEEHAAI
jgi:two-component system chemotaxis sensor kinase CheA